MSSFSFPFSFPFPFSFSIPALSGQGSRLGNRLPQGGARG